MPRSCAALWNSWCDMDLLAAFLEGIVTFVSPCLLPLLPVYLAFFAGGMGEERGDGSQAHTLARAVGFVLGFCIPFTLMGAFAGAVGSLLLVWRRLLELICGVVVVALGLSYLGVLPAAPFAGAVRMGKASSESGVLGAIAFGLAFALAWTPCVGTFLASALSLAATSGSVARGVAMLLSYSAGLGVPFVLAALLVDQLEGAFAWVKGHYDVVNRVSGVLLVVVGLLMACGLLGSWMSLLA